MDVLVLLLNGWDSSIVCCVTQFDERCGNVVVTSSDVCCVAELGDRYCGSVDASVARPL